VLNSIGWLYIRGEPSVHYRPKEPEEEVIWPPKYWKFILETEGEPKVEVAFTDARRFGRIRLVDCAAEDIRNTTPLKENGPDPVIDKHILTDEWVEKKLRSKHVPVKALLLDQANISGIGNWVGLVPSIISPAGKRLINIGTRFCITQKCTPSSIAIRSARTR
jgi:formamidopyrimidine-DNA glycosylase